KKTKSITVSIFQEDRNGKFDYKALIDKVFKSLNIPTNTKVKGHVDLGNHQVMIPETGKIKYTKPVKCNHLFVKEGLYCATERKWGTIYCLTHLKTKAHLEELGLDLSLREKGRAEDLERAAMRLGGNSKNKSRGKKIDMESGSSSDSFVKNVKRKTSKQKRGNVKMESSASRSKSRNTSSKGPRSRKRVNLSSSSESISKSKKRSLKKDSKKSSKGLSKRNNSSSSVAKKNVKSKRINSSSSESSVVEKNGKSKRRSEEHTSELQSRE